MSSTVSAIGSSLTTLAVPIIAVQQLGATPAQMGALFAAASLASLATRLPAAAWADRSREPLRVVARGQLVSGLLVAGLPVLALASLLTYTSLVVVIAALALTSAVVGAFGAPTIPLLVAPTELPAAYGRFTASRAGADAAVPSSVACSCSS